MSNADESNKSDDGVKTYQEPPASWLRMECLKLAASISSASSVIGVARQMESYVTGKKEESATGSAS